MELKLLDVVKIIGTTLCADVEVELIPIGTICVIVGTDDRDPINGKLFGVIPKKDMPYKGWGEYWYTEDAIEKGHEDWVKDIETANNTPYQWKFREDILGQYINASSTLTFQDAEDRLNQLEEKEQLPDMREKIKEYISELDKEINRLVENMKDYTVRSIPLEAKVQTLMDVKCDLESRLEGLIL